MIKKIIEHINKSQFIVSGWSILHHSFIIRRGIYRGIKNNKNYLQGRILDFGCGEKPYQKILNYDEYIGVDYQKTGHDNKQNPVDVYRDGKVLPFDDNTFDSILSSEVFEHVFNIDEVLGELQRVLKPGGYIVITIPFVIHEHEVPYDFARYTHYGINHILQKNGFKIVKNEFHGSYFDVILQPTIRFLGKITETKYHYLTLLLRIIIVAPLMILINVISLVSPKMQKGFYLSNIVIGKKE